MSDKNSTIAIYETHDQAEQAVKELQKSGFDMKKLSIVGKGFEAMSSATTMPMIGMCCIYDMWNRRNDLCFC